MPKRARTVDAYCMYRRQGTDTIYARDTQGRYNAYRFQGRTVIRMNGITTLGPIYGRVNFANDVRFNGRTRSPVLLANAFNVAPVARRLESGWTGLPQTRSANRRQTNQGMNPAMTMLCGAPHSATRYAIWFDGRHPQAGIAADQRWEWCHLLAHSMGGADDATNIVAARRGNNSEQLAIETALQMYRMEQMFEMNVSAALIGQNDGRHLGDVIKYEIRCVYGGDSFVRFLDCRNAPNPSEIHYYELLQSFVLWANAKLQRASEMFGNAVTATDRNRILQYIDEH